MSTNIIKPELKNKKDKNYNDNHNNKVNDNDKTKLKKRGFFKNNKNHFLVNHNSNI